MIHVDTGSAVPLIEQIRSGFKELVVRGLLKPGDALPAAAKLAETLHTSPATIARAYREMIKDGFLMEDPSGPRVSEHAWNQSARNLMDALQDYLRAVQTGRGLGLDWKDLEASLQMMKAQEQKGPMPSAPEILKRLQFFSRARAGSGTAVCPYCREELQEADVACCVVCGTAYHQECWNESGRCSVYGCTGKMQFHFSE